MARRWELRSIDPSSSAVRQFGDTLYNLRVRAGLTQQELAIRTGGRWSRSHIGRVENGDVTPSPAFVEAMDTLLGGDRSLLRRLPLLLLETAKRRSRRRWQPGTADSRSVPPLGDTEVLDETVLYPRPAAPPQTSPSVSVQAEPAAPPNQEAPDKEARPATNRFEFLRMTLWTGLGAVQESLRLTLRVEGPGGGPMTREQLDLAVRHYASVYWTTPPAMLFEQVRQSRQLVDGLLDHRQSAASLRHLHLAAGWLSAILGNLAFHLGDYIGARAHLGTAWQLGRSAGHHGLIAWVRGAQSMVALYDNRLQEALRLATDGQAYAPGPLARAQLASWGEARALARMRDRRGVLDAIARGGRAIQSAGEDPSPGGVFSFSVGEFEQYCGTACLWLGLSQEGKRHAEHAFQLRDTVAAKALARLDVATAESQLGRPAEAAEIGAEVLAMPSDYLINPILRRATELAGTLERHRSLSGVREFRERLAVVASG